MCGRYTLTISAEDVWEDLELLGEPSDLEEEAAGEPIAGRYNIAPTQRVPIVASRAPERLRMFKWGLVPHWADDASKAARMINARAERLGSTPAFRDAFARRRCLVIADGFYEWKKVEKGKNLPHYARPVGGALITFAGLWESWHKGEGVLRTCTIITTQPNDLLRGIHHRMPVILPPDKREVWLDEAAAEDDLTVLLRPAGDDLLELYPVGPHVNSVKNDDARNIERL